MYRKLFNNCQTVLFRRILIRIDAVSLNIEYVGPSHKAIFCCHTNIYVVQPGELL